MLKSALVSSGPIQPSVEALPPPSSAGASVEAPLLTAGSSGQPDAVSGGSSEATSSTVSMVSSIGSDASLSQGMWMRISRT